MVKIMENPIKMDDLGAFPFFWKHPYLFDKKRRKGPFNLWILLSEGPKGILAGPPPKASYPPKKLINP